METRDILGKSTKSAADALRQAFLLGFTACKGQPHTHFILRQIYKERKTWKVDLDIAYASLARLPRFLNITQADKDYLPDIKPEFTKTELAQNLTALYLQRRDADIYYEVAAEFPFSYVHIMDSDDTWNTLFFHSPDIDLYEATHPSAPDMDPIYNDAAGKKGVKAPLGTATNSKTPMRPYTHHTRGEELRKHIEEHVWIKDFENDKAAQAKLEHDEYYAEK